MSTAQTPNVVGTFDVTGYTILLAGPDDVADGLAETLGEELAYGRDPYQIRVATSGQDVVVEVLDTLESGTSLFQHQIPLAVLASAAPSRSQTLAPGWTAHGRRGRWDLVERFADGTCIEVRVEASEVDEALRACGI